MRRHILTLTVALSLSLGVFLRADDLLVSRFGDYLESLRAQSGIPGLAAIIVGSSDVQWERGFGQQDVEHALVARADTPFFIDGSTQLVTAALVLRCVEEGRLSLDDRLGRFVPTSGEPDATVRQLLTHTTATANGLTFAYRPERLGALASVLSACSGDSFSGALISLLERVAMVDSVPGFDVGSWLPASADPGGRVAQRYAGVLQRLATPYAVDAAGRPTASRYSATGLTPASGLVSTVRDLARFDLALKKGVLLRSTTLGTAWTAPVDRNGQRLPHGLAWFVQTYHGEPIVWQFGVADNASSSLILTAPLRGLTLILVANSQGLTKPFPMSAGDVTVSPFARLFLGLFVR